MIETGYDGTCCASSLAIFKEMKFFIGIGRSERGKHKVVGILEIRLLGSTWWGGVLGGCLVVVNGGDAQLNDRRGVDGTSVS